MSNITPYFYGSDDLMGSTRVRAVVTYISSSSQVTASYTPSSIDSENGIVYYTSSILPIIPANTSNVTITTSNITPQFLIVTTNYTGVPPLTQDILVQFTYAVSSGPIRTATSTIAANTTTGTIIIDLGSSTYVASSATVISVIPNVQVEFEYEKDVYYEGDSSYGLSAAIDRSSIKVGWVNNIPPENLNFYTKTSVYLKYLVNAEGSLLELNNSNNNVFEVQNTFKSGERATVSISNVTKPSFQKDLDGSKLIFKGGFSYDPVLYREDNETLKFIHLTPISQSTQTYELKAETEDQYYYQGIDRDGRNDWRGLADGSSPDNLSAREGNDELGRSYFFFKNGNRADGVAMARGYSEQGYQAQLLTWAQANNSKINFDGIIPYGTDASFRTWKKAYRMGYVTFPKIKSTTYPSPSDVLKETTLTDPTNWPLKLFVAPSNGTYSFKGQLYFRFLVDDVRQPAEIQFKTFMVLEKTLDINATNWTYVGIATPRRTAETDNGGGGWDSYNSATNLIRADRIVGTQYLFDIDISDTGVTEGTYYRFSFFLVECSNIFGTGVIGDNGVESFRFWFGTTETENTVGTDPNLKSNLTINQTGTTFTSYFYTSSYTPNLSPLFEIAPNSNTITFSPSSSILFDTASYFEPSPSESIYYTPIIDTFDIQKYDLVRFGKFKDLNATYYEVADVQISGSERRRVVSFLNPITSSYSDIQASFAILRPKPDETSVILEYQKKPGEVAQSILIPGDINKTTLDAVGDIVANLKSNLSTP